MEKYLSVKCLIFTSKDRIYFSGIIYVKYTQEGAPGSFINELPVFISAECPLYTTCIYLCCLPSIYNLYFISAVYPVYTTCIYLCCVLSIHNFYLSKMCALYTQPLFYLCCVPSIHNLNLSLLFALFTQLVFIYDVCSLYTTCIYL